MKADRHKYDKVSFRALGDDGEWLNRHAAETGVTQTANAILAGLLRAYRDSQEEQECACPSSS